MNFRYPVFLDVQGKKCLVTGEGFEVAGKVRNLVDCGAQVTYVNPQAEESIAALAEAGSVVWKKRAFESSDLDECFLVIADCENNGEIFRLAEERRVLANSVDDPEHCRFSFGALHRQNELTIAISSNGWAPALAVRLKEMLQREVGSEYGELLAILKRLRPQITQQINDFSQRKELWYRMIDSGALAKLKAGQAAEAEAELVALFEQTIASSSARSDTSVVNGHQ